MVKSEELFALFEGSAGISHVPQAADSNPPDAVSDHYRIAFILTIGPQYWGLHPTVCYVSASGHLSRKPSRGYAPGIDQICKSKPVQNALGFIRHAQNNRMAGFGKDNTFSWRVPAGYIFSQLRGADLFTDRSCKRRLERHTEPTSFQLNVLAEGDNRYGLDLVLADAKGLEVPVDASTRVLTNDGSSAWVYAEGNLYDAAHCPPARILDRYLDGDPPSGLSFGEVMKWLDRLPPGLADSVARDLSGAIEPELIQDFEGCRLRIAQSDGRLEARCVFVYQGHEVPALPSVKTKLLREGPSVLRIERQQEQEAPFLEAVFGAGLQSFGETLRPKRSRDPVEFLVHGLTRLEEQGIEIVEDESIGEYRIRRSRPQMRVSVTSDIDWFDLSVELDYDGIKTHMAEILEALEQGSGFITLADGSRAILGGTLRDALRLFAGVGRQSPQAGALRLGRAQVLAAEDILNLADERRATRELEDILKRLASFDRLERVDPAPGFGGDLRAYQQTGVDWLHFLSEHGFGGILADDMGLGKTIQALALLQLRKNGTSRTNLVVAPTSLVYNWKREAEKFTPELSVLNHTGGDRTGDPETIRRHDLVLTSYGTMRRDMAVLAEVTFDTIILDESQHVKNPGSQTFKCAMSLQGRHRLCLTGTPVENNTVELWSQMQFANPGGLGSLGNFQERFATPIESNSDEEAARHLRRLVRPFILRRRKEDVAQDLPPRVEQVIYCEMEPGQSDLYEKWRDYFRGHILGAIESDGLGKSRMKVLEGLVKLRQISNHPRLIEPSYSGSSGKLDYLMETLTELKAEGHKVLVFSQFVKMLSVIRSELDRDQVPYAYLDGKTRDRDKVVDAFQDDPDTSFFLISLRAGGTGLNLTAADHVVIVDPWWNPAVEAQAIDRTHRIGQERKVFAQKLITRGTVEEKILDIQKRKKQLARDVIAIEEGALKSLSVEDIRAFFGG